jgi:hypothetical protein
MDGNITGTTGVRLYRIFNISFVFFVYITGVKSSICKVQGCHWFHKRLIEIGC